MDATAHHQPAESRESGITVPAGRLGGALATPANATGVVHFARGSGSSRHSPRSRAVAGMPQEAGLATLLMDLLTPEDDAVDQYTREHRFDIDPPGDRVTGAIDWLDQQPDMRDLPLGLISASEEPGTLAAASRLARDWFLEYLSPVSTPAARRRSS